MMPRKEELNEEYLIRRVEETGGETRKVKWAGRRGAPDRFVGWKGLNRSAWVEVKEAEQDWGLQDHQARQCRWLKACGQHVEVLYTKAEIDGFIEHYTGAKVVPIR
jgi:hypothetical protein